MRIGEIMTPSVRAVAPGLDAATAKRQMRDARIHHLAVMDGKRLVGVVSDRDLGGAATRAAATVGELMTPQVVVATPATTLRQAANLLRGHVIGCLPVVDGKKVVGIVTTTDLLDLIGRGSEKPVATGERPTLAVRGSRRRAMVRAKAVADRFGRGQRRAR